MTVAEKLSPESCSMPMSMLVSGPGVAPDPDDAQTVLSELLNQDLRVERVEARILYIHQDVLIDVAAARRPVLYAVLQGKPDIRLAGGMPNPFNPGENALIHYGDHHMIGAGRTRIRLEYSGSSAQSLDQVRHVHLGEGPVEAIVLQCGMSLAYFPEAAWANRALPQVTTMRAEHAAHSVGEVDRFDYCPEQLLSVLRGPGSMAMACSFANMQFHHALLRHSASLWGEMNGDKRHANMRRIAAAIREIRGHPDRQWSVSGMARLVGLSRSAFAAAFHEIVGESPVAYLTRQRMERAAKLLCYDALGMHEVALRVGYDIESSFARAFKRHWGVPPRRFADDARRAGRMPF